MLLYRGISVVVTCLLLPQFMILKKFFVVGHPRRAPTVKEIVWQSPLCKWLKCHTVELRWGAESCSCGGVFKDKSAAVLGCFSCSIGISNAFQAELICAMIEIEIASSKGWNSLWLECDSKFVVQAFKDMSIVPWKVKQGGATAL